MCHKVYLNLALMKLYKLYITYIYVGESKIIRTIGTCFAVSYTAGWARQNTHGLLLYYHCGAGVTLIVHFCPELFCHKHGHSQFHLQLTILLVGHDKIHMVYSSTTIVGQV